MFQDLSRPYRFSVDDGFFLTILHELISKHFFNSDNVKSTILLLILRVFGIVNETTIIFSLEAAFTNWEKQRHLVTVYNYSSFSKHSLNGYLTSCILTYI